MKYLILKSDGKFFFRVPHPDYMDLKEYVDTADTVEKELIESLIHLDFQAPHEVLLFKNSSDRIGVIGKEFTGWSQGNTPPLSIKFMDQANVTEIKLLNMHPAKGEGYGTVTLSSIESEKELIIFFIDADYNNWDKKFEEASSFIFLIESFLGVKVGRVTKNYNS